MFTFEIFTSDKKNIVAKGFDICKKVFFLLGICIDLACGLFFGYAFDDFVTGIIAFAISLFVTSTVCMIYGAVAEIIELLNDIKENTLKSIKSIKDEENLIDELPEL